MPVSLDVIIGLIPLYGPWIVFGIVALESAGVPLPGETILVAASVLAATDDRLNIGTIVLAAAGGAVLGDSAGYWIGRRFGLPFLRKYGPSIHLDEGRLLIGQYLFDRYGSVVVFFGRFVAVLRVFAAMLAGANRMPWGRFLFFNVSGGICWASLFGFGAYTAGAQIYKISGALTAVSFVLFVAAGLALSLFIRRHEPMLRRKAEEAMPK